jgi:hypothetical protein
LFKEIFSGINYIYFFVSALLFLSGIYFGPSIVDKDIKPLLAYPRWVSRKIEQHLKAKRSFLVIFIIIFSLNNLSIFTSFLSGFLIVLPPMVAFLTGLNVSVISYEMMGWKGIWHILVNPVAWLEFPAAWIGFALAFQLAETQATHFNWQTTAEYFVSILPIYVKYIMSLLFAAAILETALIVFMEKFGDDQDS